VFLAYCFSQTVNYSRITIEITNVVINDGIVYLAIFSTAENFRNEAPDFTFALEAENTSITQELSLPNGEYVISAFQDANNNQKLDYNLFGVPRELVGMSNYFVRGFASRSFDRHKIMVDNSTGRITIGLYKL
jgi:uncharacterized protein (DUF2141 family)